MSTTVQIDDSDERFIHASMREPVVILNDMSAIDASSQNLFDSIVNVVDKNVLTSAPSCDCSLLTGMDRLGDHCVECNSTVKNSMQVNITEKIWIRCPIGVESFLSLSFLACLITEFSKSAAREHCIVSWVLNSQLRPNKESVEMNRWSNEFGMNRGLSYFVKNFDQCMSVLYQVHNKVYEKSPMFNMVKMYRKEIFPKYIPLLGKNFVIVEKNATGPYSSKGISYITDTANLMKGIDADIELTKMSHKMVDSRAARALINLVNYRLGSMRGDLFKKKSLVRPHVFATRSHFTMRCVATSITGVHDYDVVKLPWGASIAVLRLHITNRLMKRGYSPSEINDIINGAIHSYDPIVKECIDELLAMTKTGYLDILLLRNPTLGPGSVQRLKAIVKTDPKDYTISHPITNVRLLNLDFDGDEIPVTLVLDEVMDKATEYLKPHYSYVSVTEYGTLSGAFDIPKPVASIINNFFADNESQQQMGAATLELLEAF